MSSEAAVFNRKMDTKNDVQQQDIQLSGGQQKSKIRQGAMAGEGHPVEEFVIGMASGIVFGLVSPAIGHPFDSVKTRMQADKIYHNMNFRQTVAHIYKTNGIKNGFYRGFIPPVIGSMAFRSLQFSVYAGAYSSYENYIGNNHEIPYSGGLRTSVLFGAFCAALTRAAIESPLDYIKVRKMVGQDAMHDYTAQQLQQHNSLSNKVAAVEHFKEFKAAPIQTIRHLYRGFTPTFLRTLGLLGSFFIMVDYSVRYIPDIINAPGYGPFFKGGICSTTAWLFAFPFETAKSVIQADTTGKYKRNATFKAMYELYQERGIVKGLYRGFGPGASRSFIANGSSMFMFAWVQDFIRSNMEK